MHRTKRLVSWGTASSLACGAFLALAAVAATVDVGSFGKNEPPAVAGKPVGGPWEWGDKPLPILQVYNDKEISAMRASAAGPQASNKIVEAALYHLKKPYEYGADGEEAIDCSMLALKALAGAGIPSRRLPRSAADQFYHAVNVKKILAQVPQGEKPLPGDLVYFNFPSAKAKNRYLKISHVAIFMGPTFDRRQGIDLINAGPDFVQVVRIKYVNVVGVARAVAAPASPRSR